MTQENKIYLRNMTIGGTFLAAMILAWPYVVPNAPMQLARALMLLSSVVVAMVMLLTWGIRTVDGATDAWWAMSIGGHSIASALVYSAVIGAICAAFLILPRP